MVFSTRLVALVLSLALLMACDPDPERTLVSERWPQHDWSQNSERIELDINSDGEKERALIGIGKRTIMVTVLLEEEAYNFDFVEIFTNKPNQENAICGDSATIRVESQNYSLLEKIGRGIEGFQSCEQCEGILLLDDKKDCDPLHIYWDHNKQMLSWWRN